MSREEDDLASGADELQVAIREHCLSRLPAPTMSDLRGDLSGFVARFVLGRQTAALRSAVALAGQSLAQLALPFVRPACEERIWAAYLYSLAKETREQLLVYMSMLESAKTVTAQQQFLGSREMRRLGFPKAFVKDHATVRSSAEAELARLGQSLGWPADPGSLPSVGWVASQAKLDRLYDFLYSASSKGVHFSPYEVLRSGWSEEPGAEGPVTIMAEPYISYRAAFTLHWLCVLLIDTVIVLVEHGPLADLELDDVAGAAIRSAAEKVGSAGRLPIALAAEFNLHVDDR